MIEEHAEHAYEYFAAPYRERRIRTPELELWIACLGNARTQAAQLAAGVPHEKASKDLRRLRWQLTHDVNDLRAWLIGQGNDPHASQRGGHELSFPWILSQIEACLGAGCYDEPKYVGEICEWLSQAQARIDELARHIARTAMLRGNKAAWPQWRYRRLHLAIARAERTYQPQRQLLLRLRGLCPEWDTLDAGERTEAVPRGDVPGQVPGPERVLREASGPGAKAVRGGRAKKQAGRVERKQVAEDPSANPRARRVHVPVPRMRRAR